MTSNEKKMHVQATPIPIDDRFSGLIKAQPFWTAYFQNGNYEKGFVGLEAFWWGLETVEPYLKMIPHNANTTFLDIGCGCLSAEEWLLRRFPYGRLIAFDYNKTALAAARPVRKRLIKMGVKVTTREHDMVKPWTFVPKRSIDFGLANLSMCYLPEGEWLNTIDKLYEAMKYKATACCSFISKEFDIVKEGPEYLERFESLEQKNIFMETAFYPLMSIGKLIKNGDLNPPPEKQIEPAFKEAGFEVKVCEQYYEHMWVVYVVKSE